MPVSPQPRRACGPSRCGGQVSISTEMPVSPQLPKRGVRVKEEYSFQSQPRCPSHLNWRCLAPLLKRVECIVCEAECVRCQTGAFSGPLQSSIHENTDLRKSLGGQFVKLVIFARQRAWQYVPSVPRNIATLFLSAPDRRYKGA